MSTERLDAMDARARAARPHPMSIPVLATDLALSLDVITLVAALRDVMALDSGHSASNPHAYCISPLALRRAITENLNESPRRPCALDAREGGAF